MILGSGIAILPIPIPALQFKLTDLCFGTDKYKTKIKYLWSTMVLTNIYFTSIYSGIDSCLDFPNVGADTDTNDVLMKKLQVYIWLQLLLLLNVLEYFRMFWKRLWCRECLWFANWYSCENKLASHQRKRAESADFIEPSGQCVVESNFVNLLFVVVVVVACWLNEWAFNQNRIFGTLLILHFPSIS